VLETFVTRSSDKPTCSLGSYFDVDVEACAIYQFKVWSEADLIYNNPMSHIDSQD